MKTLYVVAVEASTAQDEPLPPLMTLKFGWKLIAPSRLAVAGEMCPKVTFLPPDLSVSFAEASTIPAAKDHIEAQLAARPTTLGDIPIDPELRLLLGQPTGEGVPPDLDLTVGREFGPDVQLRYGLQTDPAMDVIYIYDPRTGRCICQRGHGVTLGGQSLYVATKDGGLIQLIALVQVDLSQIR